MTCEMGTQSDRRVIERVVMAGILLVAVLWWCVYALSGYWWAADVLMSLGVHVWAVLIVCGAVAVMVWRTRRFVVVFGMCVSVGLMCVSDRRVLPSGGAGADPTALEVVTLNMNLGNTQVEELFVMLSRVGGDVLVLVEPRWEVFTALKNRRDSLSRYPYRAYRLREGDVTSPMMIISRWPLTRDAGVDSWAGVSVVVGRGEAEGGAFRLVGFHAHSPRSGARWDEGNGVVRGLVGQVGLLERIDELPLLIAGDMNGGPMTYRDRMIRNGLGLSRTSSLFDPKSTFPAKQSIFGLLIDDVWVSDEFLSGSWSTVFIPGSDHRGVRARLTMRVP